MQQTHESMECPRCDRKGLVSRNNEVYKCVYCGFRRDLSNSGENVDSILLWLIGLVIVIFVIVGLERDRDRAKGLQSFNQLLHNVSRLDSSPPNSLRSSA